MPADAVGPARTMIRESTASPRRQRGDDTGPDRRSYRSWGWRFAWLAGLWITGVAAMGLIALLLRLVMRLAGLSS